MTYNDSPRHDRLEMSPRIEEASSIEEFHDKILAGEPMVSAKINQGEEAVAIKIAIAKDYFWRLWNPAGRKDKGRIGIICFLDKYQTLENNAKEIKTLQEELATLGQRLSTLEEKTEHAD